jgi:hypothetical protein
VPPKFEVREFEDDDAIRAFVKSRSQRRHVSKGQLAMGHALLYPDSEKGGRGHKAKPTEAGGFSPQRLSYARTVLAYSATLFERGRGNLYSFWECPTELGLRTQIPNSKYDPKTP